MLAPGWGQLFVYGRFMRGQPLSAELGGAKLVGRATTAARYKLYDLGERPALWYHGNIDVEGEIYRVSAPMFKQLDRLMGPEYERSTVHVNGGYIDCYFCKKEPENARVIWSGDWRRRI